MERTCLVTKQKISSENLLRFTIQEGFLIFDPAKVNVKNTGRGGYVVREIKAIEKLVKLKGKIKYLLKVEGALMILPEEIERGKEMSR